MAPAPQLASVVHDDVLRNHHKVPQKAETRPVFVTKTPNLNIGNVEAKREEIRRYFHDTFTLYESLFECLSCDESYTTRANPLRQPLIFYFGHTSVFFINKLNTAGFITDRVDPRLESILAIGVDEMSWDDLNDNHYEWPTPQEVRQHRDATRKIVDKFIRECDCTLPISWDHPLWVVVMGIEHERIHLETSAVLIRELPMKLVQKHPLWGNICRNSGTAPENELLPVRGGTVKMGKTRSNAYYGWDNEYGTKVQQVQPFEASRYLISNAEFKKFVDIGGYSQKKYWTEEGWNWVCYRKAEHPVYWVDERGQMRLRTMIEVIDMPWDWPAEVNYLEAKAYCNWMAEESNTTIRLPTEAEWYKLRECVQVDQPDWNKAPGNINLEGYMSPCPVTEYKFEGGFCDVIGNVWQWTETAIDGFDGFEVHPVYDDFAAPTFDGKHNIFKGGSWISTGNYAIKDSRYAFRRHFFQYSGFRVIQGEVLAEVKPNIYETDPMVASNIEFQYGKPILGVTNFPAECVKQVKRLTQDTPRRKALDAGCGTGRSSFELAKLFDHVDAFDVSARLIETPFRLQEQGKQRYTVCDEGEICSFRELRLCEYEGYDENKHKISFAQGDACNLNSRYTGYDVVFAGTMLDRLYNPAEFLSAMKERIVEGGLLVLASPYGWQDELTPRESWLGGYKDDNGENYTSLEGLRDVLSPEFEMVSEPLDIPFVMRETRRKHQYSISQLTAWRKLPSGCCQQGSC